MIDFAWPWMFVLLPLPWLVRRALPPTAVRDAALRTPFIEDFSSLPQQLGRTAGGRLPLLLGLAAWLLLVTAGARPQWLGEPLPLPASGRDLMLAVDLSDSMRQTDFRLRGRSVDRLTAAKAVAEDFIQRRSGDRIGLILFGERAYLQAPLTFDRVTVATLLGEAVIGLAGKSTAIGDAIGIAVKRLRDQAVSRKVLVLMTDGANTSGAIEPLKAAELAAGQQLTIYTIGIGADEQMLRSLFGYRRVNPSSDLDEKTLQAIATSTGGQYFRARDVDELEDIYTVLDELEPVEQQPEYYRPRAALYPWPLAVTLVLGCGLLFAAARGRLGL